MATDDLPAQALDPDARFNWVFLVELLVCGLVALFFLFYFNRVFSKALSLLIRLWLRWKGLPNYVDIQSLQISLLAGRIFFGRVTYHGVNETITIVSGHITWRYWLRRVRHASVGTADDGRDGGIEGAGGDTRSEDLPCRILAELKGVEWFIYNRSPAYDYIIEQMAPNQQNEDAASEGRKETGYSGHSGADDSKAETISARMKSSIGSLMRDHEGSTGESPNATTNAESDSAYLSMLPIKILVNRGAVVMGNNNTPSVLVAHFEKADASIDATRSVASVDKYKQVFSVDFTHPVVQFKTNMEYKEPLVSRGARLLSSDAETNLHQKSHQLRNRRQKLKDLLPIFSESIESLTPSDVTNNDFPLQSRVTGQDRWVGLRMYLDEGQDEGWKFEPAEYAKVSTVLDCPKGKMNFFWDIPGTVDRPRSSSTQTSGVTDPPDEDINGSEHTPPEWGIDLSFEGGTIQYGPWTDRQRVHLQNMFAPRIYKTATPRNKLQEGESRIATKFKLFVELSSSTILRIPVREESKDWKFRRRLNDGEVRPFGWLEIKVAAESTISYEMSMVPSPTGWKNGLKLDLKSPEVRSSVNHGLLWKATQQAIDADLSGPLQWNGKHKWTFDVLCRGIEIFILREHVTLITDLVTDWATGPPSEYWSFTPFLYDIILRFEDRFEVCMNVNDQNIINNPSDIEDNTLLILHGDGGLKAKVGLDMTRFRPDESTVSFDIWIDGEETNLQLGAKQPVWNTWHSFLSPEIGMKLATVKEIMVKGSYNYYATTGPGLIDTLLLDISGSGLKLKLFGFLIRYFLVIRENYFGENLHFKTLEEWQNQGGRSGATMIEGNNKKANDLDVMLTVEAKNSCVIMPKHLYGGTGKNLKLNFASLGIDMRFTNYYMDLQVNVSPITAYISSTPDNPQIFIDGLTIYGHRLFGLPPTEPTYVCNWDLDIGAIIGECTPDFLPTAICALKGFIFGFEDKENALPVSESADLVVHDVTFIRVSLKSLKLWLRTDSPSAIRVTSGEILFILNDLADEKHSERISLSIPDLTMSCVDVNYGSGDLVQNTETSGHLGTSLRVTVFGRKKNFSKDRALQMKHVRESDFRTGRAKFLIREDFEEDGSRASSMYNENLDTEPPSLPLPSLPKPLYGGDSYHGFLGSSKGSVTSGHTGSTGIRRKSSFLAASSISSAVPSILRATSSHAPSFHSAVETLSSEIPIAAALRENLRVPLSPAPTTPGSQSPRRSMRARSRQESSDGQSFAATKSRSKVLLSSSFAKPLFPLGSVEPDLKNVPWLASGTESGHSEAAENSFTLESGFIDESTSQTSIIVDFVSGIRGYCTAVGVKAVLQLMECIQPKSPEDILDSIQISVVDRLVKLMTNKSQDSAITEVYLKIPQFKFCFTNPVPKTLAHSYYSIDGERADEDAYNLELSNLLVSARSKTVFPPQRNNQEELGGKEVFSCHILLGTLEVIMSQRQAGYQDSLLKPALCLLVQGLLFWASTNETSTASLKIETIASSFQSNQAMFLYDAAIRTEALIADLQRTFRVLSNNEKQRVQALAYSLAVAGEEFGITGDPSSLTRPSYVLRSALDHVRVNDSWKVMSRMRHIYQSVPVAPRENLQIRCISNLNQCPVDGRRWVVSAFERWRSWELADLHSSYIVDAIFGPEDSNEGPIRSAGPMEAQIGITGVKMLVDPGPMQCEFVLGHITAKSSFGNPDILNSSMVSTVAGPNLSVSTIVQAHCRSIQLGLTWEILEIFEGLSKAFAKRHSGSETSKAASVASIGSSKKQSFHVLLTTDTGSLILDTINLKSISRAHNFHASLFISRKNSDIQEALLGSILLRSDLATSELKCGNRTLSMTKLKNPSIYGHFDEHCLADTRFNIWKVAGSCEDLSFDIREEILGLMEVIDFVVNDEVSRIWRLVEDLKRSSLSRPPPQPTAPNSPTFPFFPRRNVHVLHLTLSLENFTIEATLLPSLAYVMRGNGVRGSTRPKHATEEIILDFDVLYHEHEIRTGYDKAQTRSISVLQMPSINGRVRHQDSAEEQLIEVFISVETIKLDASSIQSLLNALTKPEVGNVIESARVEWMGTQARLDEIFDTPDKPPVPSVKTGTPLVYRAHVGVSGLTIQSSAPSATLNIDLGCIRVHASNKPNADILLLPEVHVEFREITVELTKVTTDGSLETCGYIELHASILCSSTESARGKIVRAFYVTSHSLQIDLFAETASTIVDVAGHLQDKLRDLDLSREVKYLRKLRSSKPLVPVESAGPEKGRNSMQLFTSVISVEMKGIQISWITGASTQLISLSHTRQNLVLSFKRINFATATKKANEARLTIEEFLVQMVDQDSKVTSRSENSAVMPEVIFNVAYFLNDADRRLAFQAKGTSLDLRLTSSCVVGINQLETSIATASEKFRDASATWKSTPTESGAERENMFGTKRLRSVLVDADFAGAVVHISKASESTELEKLAFRASASQGRYGQFAHGDSNGITILKSPGLAFKAEYVAPIDEDPSLNAEIKISASNNILYPSVVPLILEMSSNIKEVMREPTETKPEETQDISPTESKEPSPGPAAILGKCRLNIGLRICKQEFTLSCQPIARVAASAGYDEIYVTLSTCEEAVGGRFYALSVIASGFEASLKHVYSRDSTGQLQVREVVASLMNSKHLNGSDGLSCTMKMSPIKSQLNIKQFQDFLLFREIWLPEEIRKSSPAPVIRSPEPSPMLAQRYHKVAATKAFPWNTAVSISEIDLQLDLGQSLGKNSLLISNLWMDSRKSSDWEQTMSLGFDAIKVTSVGRLSGFIHLKNMKVRTSIHWLSGADEVVQTPLIQASLGFEQLQVKASFDYQAFLLADITSFHFLMYNLQKAGGKAGDQLVGVLDGDKIQIYCTTLSASQGLALYQAFLRLRQEKIDAFNISLKDVERYLNRRSQSNFTASDSAPIQLNRESLQPPAFLSLYTDVVVMLKEVSIGIFPSTFHDTQVFKLDALNASAQFGVGMEVEKLHSKLEMTLGELRIALATIKRPEIGSSLGDVSVEDIVYHARSARGGTILKVPQVTAFMHTWHKAGSNEIEYIFKSAFKGKVDVGWNYSRVSFIKEMWANHVKEMSQRQGKIITNSHISISTNSPPPSEAAEDNDSSEAGEQRKITAVVNVPQSKYEYTALEPPIIETPQLRDMGEATPPLEWIGLHRDRLPNLTHQIVIVSLLEIAREVEDAYSKILGTS